MKRFLFSLVLFSVVNVCFGQLTEEFSDGELLNNPTWAGDLTNFKVNAVYELQLNAPDAGSSIIYTPITILDSCEWQFYFNLDFAPSNTNLLRIYLQSDSNQILNGKGYYLEVGETGNLDALKFYRQDGVGNSVLLGSFTTGALANQPAKARLKVLRNLSGIWQFFADYAGGINYVKELEINDNTYTKGDNYFGFYCLYTATRKDKYYFDDISVKQPVPDSEAPVLINYIVLNANLIDLYFNESLDKTAVEIPTQYSINNGVGTAIDAQLDGLNDKLIHLAFGNNFQSLQQYTLDGAGIKDAVGNTILPFQVKFTYSLGEYPSFGDVLINEIMADPTPVVGLPELEFIELYNNSSSLISTKNLIFTDGTSSVNLPDLNLLPNVYYILCAKKDTTAFKIFGKTIGLESLPSLNNTGDNLRLINNLGQVIDEVNYTDSWYLDNVKKLGGWSLELINPSNKCLGAENWKASESAIGGTPGKQNSVYNPAPDKDSPVVTKVLALSTDSVLVSFNEKIDSDPAQFIGLFLLNTNISITGLYLQGDNKSLILKLSSSLNEGVFYTLTLAAGFKDCSGNKTTSDQVMTFALPAKLGFHDLVLNEILFNPKSGGYDYLEIYNRTEKVFDLADLTISNMYGSVSSVKQKVNQLILPHSYILLSENVQNIKSSFYVPDTAILVQTDLPSFNDDKVSPGLLYVNAGVEVWIDSFYYDKSYHYSLLDVLDGVSLERINFNSFEVGKNNWHSAASTAGFGTPGYVNSQYYDGIKLYKKGIFSLSSQRVSPDNDGFEDFLIVKCEFPSPGFTVSINVYDSQGRNIKEIANNELAGLDNTFEWSGLNSSLTRPPLGIYIIFIKYFDLEGNVYEEKLPVVVAGRLD
ncbi:MAG: lamin tail domain-containing protein [Saprospiraceae bacterium]|nr:lamin tail domain-containing protein [Saprospiraceae bacterium]